MMSETRIQNGQRRIEKLQDGQFHEFIGELIEYRLAEHIATLKHVMRHTEKGEAFLAVVWDMKDDGTNQFEQLIRIPKSSVVKFTACINESGNFEHANGFESISLDILNNQYPEEEDMRNYW